MSWISQLPILRRRRLDRRAKASRREALLHPKPLPEGMPEQHALVASYPRSGNTWLSFMVADVLLQQNGHVTDTGLPINEREIIPDLDRGDLKTCQYSHYSPLLLAKTHVNFTSWMQRGIYLLRQPADVLVSYFYFHTRYPFLKSETTNGIADFCRRYAEQWYAHAKSFIWACEEYPDAFIPVTYESLLDQTSFQLRRVLNHFQIEFTEKQVEIAVENHQFNKHSGRETDRQDNEKFFRSGIKDSACRELDPKTLKWVNATCSHLYQEASGYVKDLVA